MGVRFPIQQQPPDFGPVQQANNAQRAVAPQQQEAQPSGQADTGQTGEPAEESTIREIQGPQALSRRAPVQQAANNAGVQTPGSIIDMLA